MDGMVTSSAAELAADGVVVLDSEEHLAAALRILSAYFSDNVPEIESALRRSSASFARRSVLGCVDAAGVVQAACVCLPKRVPHQGVSVAEIVWFGALEKGQGWGSRLFRGVMFAAQGVGCDAVLSSSTNSALRFWLTRPGVRIADVVLRNASRSSIDAPEEFGFKVAASPTSSTMERLYTERILRNRKGRAVGDFEGKPYHYCVSTSNHVWFLINPNLHVKCKVRKAVAAPPSPSPSPPPLPPSPPPLPPARTLTASATSAGEVQVQARP